MYHRTCNFCNAEFDTDESSDILCPKCGGWLRSIEILKACIDNEVEGEGVIKNLRWRYYPHELSVSIAVDDNFDRWGNSRIVEIHPVLLSIGDPTIEEIINALAEVF